MKVSPPTFHDVAHIVGYDDIMLNKPWLQDAALLLLRIVSAVVLGFQGYRIFFVHGLDSSAHAFDVWGMPWALGSAVIIGVVLLLGAVTVGIGILTPLMAALALLTEVYYTFFLIVGGNQPGSSSQVQMQFLIIAVLLALIVFGAGRASADSFLNRRS
ncbi:MAG TPA: DoxX family protein [Corynebacteriales bacterium]|nr:DoxX family protein [Mycobacteriales bacterium]